MARAAAVAGVWMRSALARRLRAVMTRNAGTDDLRMVDFGHWFPRRCGVARVAHIARGGMCRRLAGGDRTVMTRCARPHHFGMIHLVRRHRFPRGIHMAGFALVGGIDMAGVLSGGRRTVVASRTAAQHLGVINFGGRLECGRRMARRANVA